MFNKLTARAERIGAEGVARARRRIVAELDALEVEGGVEVRGHRWVGRVFR